MDVLITPRDINELSISFSNIDKTGMAVELAAMSKKMVDDKRFATTPTEIVSILAKAGIVVAEEDLLESIRIVKDCRCKTVAKQRALSKERRTL